MRLLLRRAAALALLLTLAGPACAQQNPIDRLVLEASSAKTATSTGNTAQYFVSEITGALNLQLDVTVAATDAVDTLDVFVQTTIDGTNWIDVAHFTQVVGNGGAKRHVMKINATEPQATFEVATALAAGAVRNHTGVRWRARWVIVDADVDGSFTFSVTLSGGRLGTGP